MRKAGREVIYCETEKSTKSEMSQVGRKAFVHFLIECAAKSEMGERSREAIDRLVEGVAKSEEGEVGREVFASQVVDVTWLNQVSHQFRKFIVSRIGVIHKLHVCHPIRKV